MSESPAEIDIESLKDKYNKPVPSDPIWRMLIPYLLTLYTCLENPSDAEDLVKELIELHRLTIWSC